MKTRVVSLLLLLFISSSSGEEGPIPIGTVLPLSGHRANYGIEMLRGINVAVQSINGEGGIKGRQIKLVVRDNGGDPARTSQEVANLITRENVLAVVGPVTSTNSAAAAAVCQQNATPLVLPGATSPYVTEIGEYAIRICFTDPLQSKALAKFSRNNLRSENVAVVFESSSSYSETLAELYAERLSDMGGRVVYMSSFTDRSEELLVKIDSALARNPDLLFLPLYYPEAAKVVNHLNSRGASITLLGSDGWESNELFRLTDEYAGNIYISSHFSLQFQSQSGSDFAERFRRLHGDSPNAVSALGYDAIMVLADGLQRATIMRRVGLQQALVSTREFQGATGRISINEKRNTLKDVFILRAFQDSFVFETIISGL